jgi:tetratricopeptide (TPR) repeat protein/transcriptional regulator with XRE-family HTH domain
MPAKRGRRGRSDLGLALSFLRSIKGWTQEQLADASGAKLESIKHIEEGVRGTRPRTLGRILAGLGFSRETLAEALSSIRRWRGDAPSPGAWTVADLRRELLALLAPPAAVVGGTDHPSSLENSRRQAPALWARFRACSAAGQLDLVREADEFQTSGFAELLCEKSRNAAGDSAARALHLAGCAVVAAATVPSSDGWRWRLEGYCRHHLGSAVRVGGDLNRADRAVSRAKELWDAGAGDDPGLLNAARVLRLEASLRREQRRLPEALALLERAIEINRWGETPALLIGKAKALEELGQHEAAIALLLQAAAQVDGEREPRNFLATRQLLVLNLCHLGRHKEAELGLAEVRALAEKLGNQLDLLRVDWVQGLVAAGLGGTDEAIALFGRVRAAFMAQGNAYDTALVTLELAQVYATLGRTAEVKALARESAPTFEAQGVHREAQQALALFRRAAEKQSVSAELVRGVLAYLYRSRHDAQARFQRPP